MFKSPWSRIALFAFLKIAIYAIVYVSLQSAFKREVDANPDLAKKFNLS